MVRRLAGEPPGLTYDYHYSLGTDPVLRIDGEVSA
jgi:hypothetical protein